MVVSTYPIASTSAAAALASRQSSFSDVPISENEWGVTIGDFLPLRVHSNPNPAKEAVRTSARGVVSLTGHAVILIEKIEEETYHIWQADLVKATTGLARVRFFEISKDELPEHFPKSKTYVRPRKLVNRMIQQISLEAKRSTDGLPIGFASNGHPIKFALVGAVFSEEIINCIKYARERVFLADIWIPRNESPNVLIDNPKLYTSSLAANQSIQESVFSFAWVPPAITGMYVVSHIFPPVVAGGFCVGILALVIKGITYKSTKIAKLSLDEEVEFNAFKEKVIKGEQK